MLTPQEKVTIVAARADQRAVIETLYRLQSVHLVEFHEGHDPYGLKLGRPLAEGSKASERLVRLRALLRTLGLEGKHAARPTPAAEVERRVDAALVSLEANVQAAADTRDRLRQELKDLDEREARLRPLAALPLDVADYRGYESLRVLVGTVSEPVAPGELAVDPRDGLVFAAGNVVAVFVARARSDAVADALARKGFREMEVPTGSGAVPQVLEQAARERVRVQARLGETQAELDRLARDHGDFLLAADEHLSIEVEKAEAPLAFGATEYAFVVECWVPKEEVPRIDAALRKAVGDRFHIESRAPKVHDHGDAHDHAGEDGHASPAGGDSASVPAENSEHRSGEDAPPSKYRNPAWARPFEFFTSMFSMPRYGEIDPTVVLTLAFPLFYGFMISDLGYGLIMVSLGLLMAVKLKSAGGGMRELGIGIAVAGVVATVFGGFVFQDAFGIPFYGHGPHAEEALHAPVAEQCAAFAEHAKETTWSCIFADRLEQSHDSPLPHAVLSKIGDVSTLLVLSVLAALVHLAVGLLFGVANEAGHSKKHALAKLGWLALLVAFTYQVLSIARYNELIGVRAWFPAGETVGYPDGSVAHGALGLSNLAMGSVSVIGLELSYLFLGLFVAGLALLVATEGGIALLEIPSLLANLLSYTRLAGVAVAKAAMAAAFNSLFLVGMVLGGKGIALIVIGALLVILTQTVVLVLGLLSSGIQAIRLNYVEFFTKFYKGGGTPFRAFGRERRFTVESHS